MNDIKIEKSQGKIYVQTPYNAEFIAKVKNIGGAKWDRYEKAWVLDEDYIEDVRMVLADVYGYTDEDDIKMLKLQIDVEEGDEIYEYCKPLMMFNKTIARAYGRDSGAESGNDVSFLEGHPNSGGSSKNWRSEVEGKAKIILRNVPEPTYLKEKDDYKDKAKITVLEEKEEKEEKKKEEPEKKNLDGLLPCPFCGGEEVTVGLGLKLGKPFVVRCRCGASIYGVSHEDVVKKWNTRR